MLDLALFLITKNSISTPLFVHFLYPFASPVVVLSNYFFSSDSHAWSAAPVQLDWTCLYTNVAYKITHLLIFPEGTFQLTLHDTTVVRFLYRSTQLTEIVLFLYQLPYIPTSIRLDKVRYLNLNRHFRILKKAPQKF